MRQPHDLIVRISVPVIDGYACGTGYPVGKDLILTSRHVVRPANRDPSRPIKVFWRHDPPRKQDAGTDLALEAIIWEGQGSLDAALIRCPRPETALRGWGLLSADSVLPHAKWSGNGFADAAKQNDTRMAEPFAGTVSGTGDGYLALAAKSHPELIDGWGGASGMAIFVDQRIVGIVEHGLQGMSRNTLHATPVGLMLQDPDFRRHLGYDDQQQRLNKTKRKLVKLIGAAQEAFQGVAAQMDDPPDATDPSSMADHMIEMPIEAVLRVLEAAHRELLDEGSSAAQQADVVLQAAQLIVPMLYDYAVIEGARLYRDDGEVLPLTVPTNFTTVAEIIMAGADGRQARFRKAPDEQTFPMGVRCLPHAPEQGIAQTVDSTAKDLMEHLAAKFIPENSDKLKAAIDRHLKKSFAPKDLGLSVGDQQTMKELINNRLKHERRDGTLYLLFRLPEDPASQMVMETMIGAIRTDFPELPCLILSDNKDRMVADSDRFEPLRHMLWRGGSKK